MNKANKEIFVICDSNEIDSQHILQILTKARELGCQLEKRVLLFFIGQYEKCQLEQVKAYGADIIYIYHENKNFDVKSYSDMLSTVIQERSPEIILFPSTSIGKTIAAVISTRFMVGLVADCIEIEATKEKRIYFSRAALNDCSIAKIKCRNSMMHMCTIKKDTFVSEKLETIKECDIIVIENTKHIEESTSKVKVLEILNSAENKHIYINGHAIVFCIGRGVDSICNRDRIVKLAERCGAEVVGTRAAVEMGLIEKERQIGQSGKSISPKLYVGFGVYGASQHMVGLKNANTIVAINKDYNAAIFQYANYGIIEDINVILTEIEKNVMTYEKKCVFI